MVIGIDKAGAHRLHVECKAVRHAKARLNIDRRRWKCIVRRRSSQDDQIDIVRREAGIVQRGPCGCFAERSRRLALASDITLADTRALDDPFVARLDNAFQISILDQACRFGRPYTFNN